MTKKTNHQITAFNFEGSNVRTAGTAENPLFVAKDICDVLGITNNRDALARLDQDERASVALTDTSSSSRKSITVSAINEFGLYALIASSRKPEAKKFQRWVNHEVLPQIRKTGSYGTPKLPTVFDSATLLQISQEMARLESEVSQQSGVIGRQEEQITLMEPIAAFGAELMGADNLSSMTQVAKLIHISAVTLNRFLHDQGVIFKVSGEWVPYAKYQDSGHFKIVKFVQEVSGQEGVERKTRSQLKVTGSGMELIHRLWRNEQVA